MRNDRSSELQDLNRIMDELADIERSPDDPYLPVRFNRCIEGLNAIIDETGNDKMRKTATTVRDRHRDLYVEKAVRYIKGESTDVPAHILRRMIGILGKHALLDTGSWNVMDTEFMDRLDV